VPGPSRADNCARWRRERADSRSRANRSTRALAAAIDVGDARYRRLCRRLDDYGTRLGAARVKLHVHEA
jgi:hypothetical protein